ncbi:hypothetical protein [Desulfobacula toluolica]|uniref:Uncharacterized protein n=1 Tax=Desulfobacula toluolica (strain DSM 7467 / Tol2) TaxID=651182 RepID=K0NKJ1_DESTT|nr:hypothetical protein [Desulfobacula toluolica]CCK80458.1 uncharacterized protein TOL2_C22970 [Desulfobacula toluolica Tol2]
MKRKIICLAAFFLAFIMVQIVNAAGPVAGLFLVDSPTLLSDNSAEIFIDKNSDGEVTPGDILVTITGITTIHSTTIGSGTAYNEVTALTAIKILSSNNTDVGPVGPDDSFGDQNIDLYEFLAGPVGPADSAWFNWSTGEINLDGAGTAEFTFTPVSGASNDGILLGFVYEDSAQNYNRSIGIQEGLTATSDGDLRLTIGLIPENSDFLSVRAPLYPGAFGAITSSTAIDNTNISLDATILTQNWAPLNFNDNFTGGNGGFSSPESSSQWPIYDNLDFTVTVVSEVIPGECRMTGGNATVSPAVGADGLPTWTYLYEGEDNDYWITTGGQIGAPSGGESRGHWTHTQHGGAEGSFGFHSGTSSAPEGTEISTIECADPGWCVQARCAPFKQIFWTGIGIFAFQHFDAELPGVVPYKKNNPASTFHYYRAMVGDFGENDRPTREASLIDENTDGCNWIDRLKEAGFDTPPGPYEASDAVFLDSEPDPQFGDKGGQICDKCPDYYQIEIYAKGDPNDPGEIIYKFQGFLEHGNYQIHPETGEKCPAIIELIPELFESKK